MNELCVAPTPRVIDEVGPCRERDSGDFGSPSIDANRHLGVSGTDPSNKFLDPPYLLVDCHLWTEPGLHSPDIDDIGTLRD